MNTATFHSNLPGVCLTCYRHSKDKKLPVLWFHCPPCIYASSCAPQKEHTSNFTHLFCVLESGELTQLSGGGGCSIQGKHQIYHSSFHLVYGKNQYTEESLCCITGCVQCLLCFWCETDGTTRHMNNQEHYSVLPSSFSSQMEPKLAWTESVLHEYQQGISTVECWVGCTVRCLTSVFFICRFLHRCSY